MTRGLVHDANTLSRNTSALLDLSHGLKKYLSFKPLERCVFPIQFKTIKLQQRRFSFPFSEEQMSQRVLKLLETITLSGKKNGNLLPIYNV